MRYFKLCVLGKKLICVYRTGGVSFISIESIFHFRNVHNDNVRLC